MQKLSESRFPERLGLFIEELGISINQFESELGFSQGSINKIIRGNKSITSDRLQILLEKFPNLNAEWLLRGQGEMYNKDYKINHTANVVHDPDFKYGNIPKKAKDLQEGLLEALKSDDYERAIDLVNNYCEEKDLIISELERKNSSLKDKLVALYEEYKDLTSKLINNI